MSYPSDRELDRRLAEVRPVPPAGFADAVLRRLPARRPRRWVPVAAAAAVICAAAATVLMVMRPRPAARWQVAAGSSLRVPADGELRLEQPAGAAIHVHGGATLRRDEAVEEIHLALGRARLEGRAAVATAWARVSGTADDALVDVEVQPKENTDMLGMSLKTASTALAAAAAGTVLTVAVVRGTADVRPESGPTVALRAGDRTTLPPPSPAESEPVVASATSALRSPAAKPPVAAAPAPAADDAECPQVPAAGSECDGQPCADCDGDGPSAAAAPPPTEEARVDVSTDGAPSLGPADARVTIIEFTDYQCRFCEKAMSTVHSLAEIYPKDVRIVLKNFPLPGHKQARLAAEAALAAGEQGKYWEMHDVIMANQENLGRAALDDYAQKLGLDVARFRTALDDGRHRAQVDRDIEDATALGLKGVPSFVINGRVIAGAYPLERFKQIIDEELAR